MDTNAIRAVLLQHVGTWSVDSDGGGLLLEILSQHPWADEKLPGATHIVVTTRRRGPTTFPEVHVRQPDGTLLDVSWKKCASDHRESDVVRAAMRTAIKPQIVAFREGQWPYDECELCQAPLTEGDWHVDHIVPFQTLAATFRLSCQHPPVVIDNERGHPTLDPESPFGATWIAYHAEAASLRVVHATCNLRRRRDG